jgi:hypothetical protein
VATTITGAVAEARADLLDLGGRDAVPVAAAIERLETQPAFSVMVTASRAARPQWAGIVDDLYERPAMRNARQGLHNALMATISGESLYRNVFFSFADSVILWHYGHTRQRSGGARIAAIYDMVLRLLAAADEFRNVLEAPEPEVEFFHRLRKVSLHRDDAYPLLRRAGRLLGAVEAGISGVKLHPVRGTMLTSYASFSAQVTAMGRALRAGRSALDRQDVLAGILAFTELVETPPAASPAPPAAAEAEPPAPSP